LDLKALNGSSGNSLVHLINMSRLIPHASQSCSFAFQQWGKGNAKKVLCFHGWLDNSSSFSFLGPALADRGFDVVAVDHQGHGRSSHLGPLGSPASYTYTHGCQSIKVVIDALAAENTTQGPSSSVIDGSDWNKPYAIVGHSMSSGMVLMFAGAYPEHTHRIVLLEGFGPLTASPIFAPKMLRKAINGEITYRSQLGTRPARIYPSLAQAIDARVSVVASYPGKQQISRNAAAAIVCRSARLATSDEIQAIAANDTTFLKVQQDDARGGDDSAADLTEAQHATLPIKFRYDSRLTLPSHLYLSDDQVNAFVDAIEAPSLLVSAECGWPASNQDAMEARKSIMMRKGLLTHAHVPGSHHCHLDDNDRDRVLSEMIEFFNTADEKQIKLNR
jgi:pimeloyl-ACP methyl ester carboxylesterase